MDSSPGRRLYRLLLRAFPPGFRRARGGEMERLFVRMRRDAEQSEGSAGAGFWTRVLWDTLSQAAGAWLDVIRRGGSSPATMKTKTTTNSLGDHMSILIQDLRYGIRQITRRPLFSATIVLLVAVGIAGNAAVFRLFNGLFLRPLPFHESERLVDIDVTAPQWNLEYVGVAIPDYRAWAEASRTLESIAAFDQGGANLATEDAAQRITYLQGTHTLDDVLRLEPELGRFFTAEEDEPGAPWVALLTRGFWERHFAADPDVVGRTLRLDGEAVEVIGVLPEAAGFVAEADVWLPLREDDRSPYYLSAVGRLKPDATVAAAREDLQAIHAGRAEERHENQITSPVVASLRDRYLGPQRLGSGFLLGAVAVVLLIACANIAGLMFARSVARIREMAVRRALGASRRRIVRQLLTESLLLAGLGGVLGTWAGVWASRRLLTVMSDQFPTWVTFDLDGTFLAFTALATVGAAVLFGLLPALQASRQGSAAAGLTRSTASAGTRRTLSLLVGGEVALAAALLVVGGLTVLDVRGLSTTDPGFRADGLLTYRLQLSDARYPDGDARLAFTSSYLERLRDLPSVQGATVASTLPLMGHSGWFFEVEGVPERAQIDNQVVLRRWMTPGYFDVTGVQLLRGRAFDDFDGREEGSRVVVVNEAFVRTHIPEGTDPLGRRIRTGEGDPWYTIIGVARDVLHYGTDEPMRPGTYEPIRQNPVATLQVALRPASPAGAGVDRGSPDASDALANVRALTREMDPELAVFDERSMESRYDEALLIRKASAWLIGVFSAVALLLAVAGLYGVISYTVGQRSREIGIRMAMGARASQVRGRVVRQGMGLAGVGVALGLAAALALKGVVSGMLVDVSATDPWVYLGVGLLLLAVAALANWMPARRAARLDPMAALRTE